MGEDEHYAGHDEENHPEAEPIQQVHSPTAIWLWHFHFGEPSRQDARMELQSSVWRHEPVVVRDTRSTSGRSIALKYNFSCSKTTTFIALSASHCAKSGANRTNRVKIAGRRS